MPISPNLSESKSITIMIEHILHGKISIRVSCMNCCNSMFIQELVKIAFSYIDFPAINPAIRQSNCYIQFFKFFSFRSKKISFNNFFFLISFFSNHSNLTFGTNNQTFDMPSITSFLRSMADNCPIFLNRTLPSKYLMHCSFNEFTSLLVTRNNELVSNYPNLCDCHVVLPLSFFI